MGVQLRNKCPSHSKSSTFTASFDTWFSFCVLLCDRLHQKKETQGSVHKRPEDQTPTAFAVTKVASSLSLNCFTANRCEPFKERQISIWGPATDMPKPNSPSQVSSSLISLSQNHCYWP